MQVAVALEAVEQHVETLAEVAGAEVGEAGLVDGLGEQPPGGRVARPPSACLDPVGIEVLGHAAEPVAPVRPGTGR